MYFILTIASAICAAIIAKQKNRSGIGWFVLGLLISIFAPLLVWLLPANLGNSYNG